MKNLRLLPLVLLAVLVVPAPPATAQKLARKAYEDSAHGYKFTAPDDFTVVPPQPQEAELGIIVKMGGKDLIVRTDQGSVNVPADAVVLRFAESTVRGKEGPGGSVSETKVRDDVGAYLELYYKAFDKDKPQVDEEVRVKKLLARHRTWTAQTSGYGIGLLIDTWSFQLSDADVHLIFMVPEEFEKKWMKVFEKSAKTFMEIKRSAGGAELEKGASYEDMLAYHKAEAETTPGWTAVETPSKKFIIKTNSDKKKLIKDVTERLEKSRELYEEDFPPPPGFDHVSIVRLCNTEEDFHLYGGTGGGVAGWFNPGTTELVLYNSQAVDPNMTYAVMSHEAFHQYCHFLFEQSEAHRWFDEGHGDYYGGVDFKGSKAIVTPKMPAGLNRLDVIKEMVRDKSYKPIAEHINYDHGQWQGQGPSNVACYAQSWSIIYMLRQGTLGKIPKKYWKDEYAGIIPNYVKTLHAGFRKAYDEIIAEREKEAAADGRELEPEEREVNRFDLRGNGTEEIWKAAMDASWGKVDIDQFQADWLAFVEDVL
jgi:hypothetical protein